MADMPIDPNFLISKFSMPQIEAEAKDAALLVPPQSCDSNNRRLNMNHDYTYCHFQEIQS
jgi:hypothetical protein